MGRMIGGAARNLRPRSCPLPGGLEVLKDLVKEYGESVDNDNVTGKDHHENTREMNERLKSIKPYCRCTSDRISAVREQAVQLNASTDSNFTLP